MMNTFTHVFLLFFMNNIIIAVIITSLKCMFLQKIFTKDKCCQVNLNPEVWRDNEIYDDKHIIDCAL